MSARTLFSRFETGQASYVYDTSTNAILGVSRQLWEQLATVERDASQQPAANEAVTALQAEGYLQPCEVRTMQFYSPEMLRERVFNAIPQLTLELTERCNLRCRYCAFTYDNDRISQCRAMGRETAVHAVDIFLAHSRQAATPTISFWGGEPLLGFRLMRAVIEYGNSRAADRPLRYSFTTNATLVTPAIAAFLARNRVDLLVSLDGPRHVHDQNRRGKADTATFDRVIAGLQHLKDADAEYYRTVRFNCVAARDTDLDEPAKGSALDIPVTREAGEGRALGWL